MSASLNTPAPCNNLNLRQSVSYRRQRQHYEKTKASKAISIGERRKPRADNQPGYIRIDTVHQGDLDGVKGVYHINAVDEVTQFEVVASVERISPPLSAKRLVIAISQNTMQHTSISLIKTS